MPKDTIQDLMLSPGDLFPEHKRDQSEPAPPYCPPEVDSIPVQAHADTDSPSTARATITAPQTGRPHHGTHGDGPAVVLHTRVVTGCGGGPDKTIFRSPRFADPNRYQMAAAYLYPQADPGMCVVREAARRQGCTFYEIPETGALDHHVIGAMVELCKELKVDIWHSHDYKTNALGLLVKRFHPMKMVTTAHGFTRETWRTRLYVHVDNLAMLGYEQVIAVSPQLIKHCAYHGVNPQRLTHIPNAIDAAEYTRTQTTDQAKRAAGLPTDRFAVGVIGRLSLEKGVDRAIRMMPSLLAKQPLAELHLIGDGPKRKELEALAIQLGVANALRWWGWQAEAKPIYEMLDALLLPSRTEGLPNVVLEAMAMRVPVAATDVGGVSDLLDQGNAGVILGQDERAWAQQLAPLLNNSGLTDPRTHLAHRRVHDVFSFQSRMQKVMAIYDKVLGRSVTANGASGTRSTQTRLAA